LRIIRIPRRLVAAPLALAALGCHATESFDPPRSPALVAAEPLPVTLSNDLRGLRERDSVQSQETTFRIGRLLQRLFVARDGLAFLSAVATNLETEWQGPDGWSSSYSVSVHLQLEGTGHLVTASAQRSAAERELASHLAIEDCVAELYSRVAELLRASARPGAF